MITSLEHSKPYTADIKKLQKNSDCATIFDTLIFMFLKNYLCDCMFFWVILLTWADLMIYVQVYIFQNGIFKIF